MFLSIYCFQIASGLPEWLSAFLILHRNLIFSDMSDVWRILFRIKDNLITCNVLNIGYIFFIWPLVQWGTGAVGQWGTGALGHWGSGALGHWGSGAVGQWCTGAVGQWCSEAVVHWGTHVRTLVVEELNGPGHGSSHLLDGMKFNVLESIQRLSGKDSLAVAMHLHVIKKFLIILW